MLTSVPVRTESGFVHGRPVPLFQAGQHYVSVARNYDVSADGRRFVFVKTATQGPQHPHGSEPFRHEWTMQRPARPSH
jgi:hypothetical protein